MPWEKMCTQAYELKRANYIDRAQQCREVGCIFTAEAGCRGFPAPLLGKMLQVIGVTGNEKRVLLKTSAEAAEKVPAGCCFGRTLERINRKVKFRGVLLNRSLTSPHYLKHTVTL